MHAEKIEQIRAALAEGEAVATAKRAEMRAKAKVFFILVRWVAEICSVSWLVE
jgi:hypothetical protein